MRETAVNRKTKYTRMTLQNALVELMEEKPISHITIKELCEKADINRSTFYTHYGDQYQLLKSIEDETISWAEEIISGFSGKTEKEDFITNIEKVFEYLIGDKNHVQVLMSEQGDIDFQRNLMFVLYEQCARWLTEDLSGDIAKNELYFVFLVNGSVGLIQYWLKNGMRENAREMSEIIYDMTRTLR